jgi:hypothetical protein
MMMMMKFIVMFTVDLNNHFWVKFMNCAVCEIQDSDRESNFEL